MPIPSDANHPTDQTLPSQTLRDRTATPEMLPCDPPLEPPQETTIEQSIRAGREFSLAEVIGREAGDFLKGVSPIPPLEQTKNRVPR